MVRRQHRGCGWERELGEGQGRELVRTIRVVGDFRWRSWAWRDRCATLRRNRSRQKQSIGFVELGRAGRGVAGVRVEGGVVEEEGKGFIHFPDFVEEASGAQFEAALPVFGFVVAGHDDDGGFALLLLQGLEDGEAVETGEAEVEG